MHAYFLFILSRLLGTNIKSYLYLPKENNFLQPFRASINCVLRQTLREDPYFLGYVLSVSFIYRNSSPSLKMAKEFYVGKIFVSS